MGVDPNPIARIAAEQLPDRFTAIFAEDVPQRLLDRAHRGEADHAQGPEAVLDHALEQIGMLRGSRPISIGAKSSMQPTTARVFHSSVPSPQP